jgi:hypothetical protein
LLRDCHDGVVAPIEDARTYASVFLETCREALKFQYDRVLDLAEVPRDTTEWRAIEPDCYPLVLALQQAIVGVEAVAHFEGQPIETWVDDHDMHVMTREHHGLEDLRHLRNMLTHFDLYLKGEGNLQKPKAVLRGDVDEGRDFDMHRKWRYDPHSDRRLLWVRAMGKSVEVLGMSRWAMGLIDKVRDALIHGAPQSSTST